MFEKRRHVAAPAALALALTAGLTACAGEEPDPFEGIPAFPVDTPQVQLLVAGENPQPLRYSLAADAETGWDTTVKVAGGISQEVAEDYAPEAPAGGDIMETTLPLSVTTVTGQDNLVDLIAGAGKHSDLALGQDVAANEGFATRWEVDERGQIATIQLLPPVDSPEPGREVVEKAMLALTSAAVVFPEEPVGVGGSWTVTTRVAGGSTTRTTTYTVDAVQGDTVELGVGVEERPVNKKLPDESLSVEHTATTSDGHLTVDLRRPLPVAGRVAATTRVVYAGEGAMRVIQDDTNAITYGAK